MRAVRLVLVDTGLAVLGAWAGWAQAFYRVPNAYLTVVLAGLTVAATALTVLFWLYAGFSAVAATRAQRRPLQIVSGALALCVVGFAFYSLFVFTNGKFDVSEPVSHATEIVSIGMEEPTLGVAVPVTWATVHSWRTAGTTERILLRPEERQRLWGGQPVIVSVRNGFYGRPWISAIEPDVEIHSRAVLALVPRAAQVRKDLAWFQARSGRFADAATTTRDYARDFPEDRDFPLAMAKLLTTRDRFPDVITILADIAPRHEDAEAYMLLGYALAMQGRQRADGLAYLERARALQPRNWWPHYALGWAYAAGGDYRRAVPAFEQAVALRRGLSDAERELQRLRPLVAGTPAR